MSENNQPGGGNPAKLDLAAVSEEALRAELEARAQPAAGGPAALFRMPAESAFGALGTNALLDALRDKQRVIYGVDDRKDHYEIDSAGAKGNAEAVVALFDIQHVVDQGDGTSRLQVKRYKSEYGLCDDEPFADQPCGAFCSGVLVAPDVVASAGHCVDPTYLARVERIRFVFGFRMNGLTTPVVVVPNSDVYAGKAIIGYRHTTYGADWCLVRLDRPVTNRTPARLRTAGKIGSNAALYVIGHPCGLPLKYAPGARVTNNAPPAHFTANLDTYGGNSGSPVFNTQHEVEGLLVRGKTDFVRRGQCMVSLVVPTSGSGGEDVTRMSEVLPSISLS